MTKKELNSYRLTSMDEPTDEQLAAIMKAAAKAAKKKNDAVHKAFFQDIHVAAKERMKMWIQKHKPDNV